MRTISILSFLLFLVISPAGAQKKTSDGYYEIRTYHLKNEAQEAITDEFLKDAFLPALHRSGIAAAGVFKPIDNDTSADRRIIVLIPYRSFTEFENTEAKLLKDAAFQSGGSAYLNAPFDSVPYLRIEKTLLKNFVSGHKAQAPKLSSPKAERIYELRSYEGPTEKLHAAKVKMFVVGDEISLFNRLSFNAIFYGEVLAGKSMPNLMYMTSFENIAARDEHWKSFFADAHWKKISAMTEYEHTVSHSDIYLLHPTDYSDL
jgi:hypothetical protein